MDIKPPEYILEFTSKLDEAMKFLYENNKIEFDTYRKNIQPDAPLMGYYSCSIIDDQIRFFIPDDVSLSYDLKEKISETYNKTLKEFNKSNSTKTDLD